MFKVEHLRFRFRDGHEVLKDVNFSAQQGEFMAILGNNGAGKSTMLKCVNRILPAQGGSAVLSGEDLLKLSTREVAKRVAFVAQTVPETAMTVHDVVMLGRRPYMGWSFSDEDHRIVHEAMDKMGVSDMRGRFLSQLSGGERQKVMLARALAQQPRLLLLDEPTSSLDLSNQYQVLETVREICHREGIIAMVVIHDLNLALRFCDTFAFLKDGEVFRCGDSSVIDRETLKAVYRVDAEQVSVNGQQIVLVDQ